MIPSHIRQTLKLLRQQIIDLQAEIDKHTAGIRVKMAKTQKAIDLITETYKDDENDGAVPVLEATVPAAKPDGEPARPPYVAPLRGKVPRKKRKFEEGSPEDKALTQLVEAEIRATSSKEFSTGGLLARLNIKHPALAPNFRASIRRLVSCLCERGLCHCVRTDGQHPIYRLTPVPGGVSEPATEPVTEPAPSTEYGGEVTRQSLRMLEELRGPQPKVQAEDILRDDRVPENK